jgi:hypothetical protein
MQAKAQKPDIEFAVIIQRHPVRLKIGREYADAKHTASNAATCMEKNTRSLNKYTEVTFYILGFHPNGSLFFGHKVGNSYGLKEMVCKLPKSSLIILNWHTPFIDDYV